MSKEKSSNSSMRYSVVVHRAETGELAVTVVQGEVLRDSFSRVSSGLSLENAQKMSLTLLEDFENRGELWKRYQHGDRAIPALEDSKYIKDLAEYTANPTVYHQIVTVCQTPEVLKEAGINADKITISPNVINKCLATAPTPTMPNFHNLGTEILKQLPSQLREPAILMKSKEVDDTLVAVTTLSDKRNLPVIIALTNKKNGELEVCNISSTYGKAGFEKWLQKHIHQNKIIMYNKEKTSAMSHSIHLLLTNYEKSVSGGERLGATYTGNNIVFGKTANNTIIPQNYQNVNTFSEKNQKNLSEIFGAATKAEQKTERFTETPTLKIITKAVKGGKTAIENTHYSFFAGSSDVFRIQTDETTIKKLAEKLNSENIKFSAVLNGDKSAALTVRGVDLAIAEKYAKEINPSYAPKTAPRKLSFSEILGKFSELENISGNQHRANCPCCKDTGKHLYINFDERTNKVLLDCKKGCSFSGITAAAGLKQSDLFINKSEFSKSLSTSHTALSSTTAPTTHVPPPPSPKEKWDVKEWRQYFYTSPSGETIYRKDIAVLKDGDKKAVWRRPDPLKPGNWIKDLGGEKPPLYGLPNLATNAKIYIVEGEKDVETMKKLGLPAVCSPHGSKWDSRFAPLFDGKEIVVITDNDTTEKHKGIPPGIKYGSDIQENLSGVAKSVIIIPAGKILPYALKEGGDISDIVEKSGVEPTKNMLLAREKEKLKETTAPCSAHSFSEIDIEINEEDDGKSDCENHELDEIMLDENEEI